MARAHPYTDDELVDAVNASRSWRGVLRELGLAGTSSRAIRGVRHRVDGRGISHAHFVGQRRWTDEQLSAAVAAATSWSDVLDSLNLDGDAAAAAVRGHAARLALDTAHLAAPLPGGEADNLQLDIVHLDRAGSLLAAAWFTLSGAVVSWPLEPSRYDLIVSAGDDTIRRVQVKTTTVRQGASWKVYLSTTSGGRRVYNPAEIDEFFVIDGELGLYRIPVSVVGGLHAIHLNAYAAYRVADLRLPMQQ